MRGRDAIAVALRHPDGRIVFAQERLGSRFHNTKWAKLPFVRGAGCRPVLGPRSPRTTGQQPTQSSRSSSIGRSFTP